MRPDKNERDQAMLAELLKQLDDQLESELHEERVRIRRALEGAHLAGHAIGPAIDIHIWCFRELMRRGVITRLFVRASDAQECIS